MLGASLAWTGAPLAQSSQTLSPSERLRALAQPEPVDPYAAEKAQDLARIAAHSDRLFGSDPDRALIVLFVDKACADCLTAREELQDLAAQQNIRVQILDLKGAPDTAALFSDLGLDLVPSYVMSDRLIRGHMPALVLERYLQEAR